ncbi:MAG TPA: cation:proton antiporter [Conexibacter sp.]|jgi:NhaP-type Na+/H+ or K+/H+ antiporter
MEWALAIISATLLLVALGSSKLVGTPFTPAMVFVAVGVVVGPLVLDEVHLSSSGETARTLAEATLALVLFADASSVDLRKLRRDPQVPVRLLAIGLPLTIVAGALAAILLFGQLTVTEALVLAVLLAPTDAALGQAVVTNEKVPARIRRALNVESGLNDGICVPLLLIVLATAETESHVESGGDALRIVFEEIGYGVAAGVAVGGLAALVLVQASRRGLVSPAWRQAVPLASAFLAYGIAAPLGGSGFIAAFVAGMAFGHLVRREAAALTVLSEEVGQLLNGVTFTVFGATLLGPALEHVSWQVLAYAVLSLTLVRMIPVALSLVGTAHASAPTVGFLGWFGPRGLASIVFAVIVVEESNLPHVATILVTTYVTIGLSVLLHGLTAAPLADRYAAWSAARGQAPAGRTARPR